MFVSGCSISAMEDKHNKYAANQKKLQNGQVVEYPGISDGIAPHESLISSIEDGKNEIKFYVKNFGIKIFKKADPVTGWTLERVANEVGNHEALGAIQGYLARDQKFCGSKK